MFTCECSNLVDVDVNAKSMVLNNRIHFYLTRLAFSTARKPSKDILRRLKILPLVKILNGYSYPGDRYGLSYPYFNGHNLG